MRKLMTGILCMAMFCTSAIAQNVTIRGRVTDSAGVAIPGASVSERGTNAGSSADNSGNFSISVPDGAMLIFSATGFQQVERRAENNMTVQLRANPQSLTEVVVTALGITRQKKELGYSTARVTSNELNQARPVNLANGLQGKVSGLNITSVNNGVFEDVKINLRGIRSLTGNNNPLLVLDGVPTGLNFLSSINPNDIADVNILKGSSAAAVYGPDARNGAIIVSTKRGTRGKPVITLSNSTQFQKISFYPKWQTQFGSGGYGEYIPYENWSWGPAYDGTVRPIGHPLEDGTQDSVVYSAKPNERKNFFNTGLVIQNDISYAAQDFFMSVQDANIQGIVPDDKNRRTGVRVSTSRDYGIFNARFNVNYTQQNFNVFDDDAMETYNTNNNVGLNGGLLNLIFNTPAHIPLTSFSDFKNNKFADYNGYFNDYGLNPYFALDNWRRVGKRDNLFSNIELNLKAASWLNFTYRAAATIDNLSQIRASKGEVPSAYAISERSFSSIPGAFQKTSSRSSRLSSEFFANLTKTFNDFRVNLVAGTYFRQNDFDENIVGASNLVVPELNDVSNRTGELNGSTEFSRSRLLSFYATAGLSYKGWANLEVTGRTDKTSVLSPENNQYFYPGASLSLVLSDALPGIKAATPISFLKVRGSYNKTGNADINPYQLAATFSQANGFPYGSLPGYTADNTSYDPNLRPEFIKSLELGAEIGLFKNRVNVEATYFNQDNTDQIIPIRVSAATGYTNSYVNAASFINKGIELDLRITPLVRFRNGSINFKANATYNDSKIGNIYQGLDELFIGGYNNFAANYAIRNQPAFVFKATDYIRDPQGRVVVDETGYPQADPNTKIFGRTLPLWIVGLNPSITWKGLTFSVLGEYKGGHYAYHNIGSDMAWTGVSAATAINNRERFVFPNSVIADAADPGKYTVNTDLTIPNVNDFFTGVYRDVATNFLTSAAAWRIREVTLAYDLPANVVRNIKFVQGISVALTARNLFLWVPSTNEFSDPDFSFSTGNTSGVSDSQINPPVRTLGFNVSVRF